MNHEITATRVPGAMRVRARSFVLGTLLIAALSGCATSTPEQIPQVDEARTKVRTLEQDPLAARVATRDLDEARIALTQAEEAQEKRVPTERTVHFAYLARRHAEIGLARSAEARAREEVAQSEDARNRILLEARTEEAQRARSEAAQRAAEAEQARATAQSAVEEAAQLRQEFADLQTKQTDRGTVVMLGGDVLFDTGKSTLKPGATESLERIAAFLKREPDVRVMIEGHTDSTGGDELNRRLSEARADAVKDALADLDVPSQQLNARGRGSAYPVATNATPAGRQQNRRVEVLFSDPRGNFPGEPASAGRP